MAGSTAGSAVGVMASCSHTHIRMGHHAALVPAAYVTLCDRKGKRRPI